MLNEDNRRGLIQLARAAIAEGFGKGVTKKPGKFKERRGVFVTLTLDGELRGCIGYVEPVMSLDQAVINAAKAAAFEDPRFSPLDESEFKRIKIEISVLTKPQLIKVEKPEDYVEEITIGVDGLVAEHGLRKGLLLPQVAIEHSMSKKEFLSHTCLKAGLPPDHWIDKNCKVYKFQAEVFHE